MRSISNTVSELASGSFIAGFRAFGGGFIGGFLAAGRCGRDLSASAMGDLVVWKMIRKANDQ
jgi:hypothetical protein